MDIRRARHTRAHHTRPRLHKNILQPHQTKETNRLCAVAGMARAKSLVNVASDQPKTNINLRHVSKMVNNVQQRTTKPSCSRTSRPRVSNVPENRIRDLALQTKTNVDHLRPTRWLQPQRKNAETVAELSRGTPSTTTLSNRDTPTRNTPFDTN